ncbi:MULTISPECIES: ABC transporter permease [Polaribacter]|jgi:phospholipid/cholesterol/gamma-HCH transport system permease protein|uniref:ABC transporter permease n=1 Tax=Polaribacter sejongensis TaxID=985043 RepID=A0AAJ1VG53_9FLAO|nr:MULTISPECIES: ABC transporter permease [Polaribacter]AUC22299.1 ABC transporter permease [Polaribacter sejongensis]MDN3619241.1 ABC transporter permease [Polaribacter undariae]QXP64561.1 ABC transporter permease [Polaribacter sp. HaHaR_3_91]QXP67056.1 ABC transporter permease [Polaribacter sp. AHE13PA]QXP69161.1 ABC transporter permease [Polaribacter sp. R2A056_3_33]
MGYLEHVGKYFMMLGRVFKKPQKGKVFYEALIKEIDELGLKSLGIIMFISFFIGGVIALQTALNLDNPFIPKSLIGFAAKRSIILEFAPTFCSIILAGKVGSYITSSIGTMRVTEQIDALEVMGINALSHLVLPKVIATVFFYPFLISLGMFLGILGGWVTGVLSGLFSGANYIEGIQTDFDPFLLSYAIIKTLIFAFLISTVPSYHGYYVKGGSIAVGKASTQAVVWTTILIVIANYFLTQMLLT